VHDGEGVNDTLPAAFDPIGIPGVTIGTDVSGVEIGGIAGLAMAQPEFSFLAFFPIKVRFWLGTGRRDRR